MAITLKLTEKIHQLKLGFEINLSPGNKMSRFVNCLIIFEDNGITLIDTGVKGSEKIIFDLIKQNNRDHSEITKIILSHSHPDHIGSAAKIKELTGCEIIAHVAEREWIEDISIQKAQRPVPGFYELVDQSVSINTFINDMERLKIDDDISLEFIHAPGHSKGSLNIRFLEDNILFTADSIPLKGDIPNYDCYPELMHSLNKIKTSVNTITTVLTSWTPPLYSKDQALSLITTGEQYLLQIDDAVKSNYHEAEHEPLAYCKQVIEQMNLPPFFANPIVDRAFRSHILKV